MDPFSRRSTLRALACGFGGLAFDALCAESSAGEPAAVPGTEAGRLPSSTPKPRAKRVIFLCMSGGPAQMDTFDYKPQVGKKPHPGSAVPFARHGESGMWVSDRLPHLSKHVDRLCMLNGMYADTGNHAQSFLQLHTGERLRTRPSLGSWVVYGLGTENRDIPGFVSLNTSKPAAYSSAFLPPVFSGTPIGVNGESMSTATIHNISGDHLSYELKRRQVDLIQTLNRGHSGRRAEDARLEAVIESMELGFRMQAAAPGLLDVGNETARTLERYRVGKQQAVGSCRQTDFGRQCLLARRLVEAGVRFVELNHGSWDQHSDHRNSTDANCAAVDAPIAALLQDLAERGLLEETLVVWGGEFGRPGISPDDKQDGTGHNHRGFTFWLAGGGVRGGYVHGQTDETGSRAVEGKVHFRDLHATILHLLGLDHQQLTFTHEGRRHRLTGPEGGHVVRQIIAS